MVIAHKSQMIQLTFQNIKKRDHADAALPKAPDQYHDVKEATVTKTQKQ